MLAIGRASAILPLLGVLSLGCGSGGDTTGAGGHGAGGAGGAGATAMAKVEHLVVIIQENHTFDNHFGRYCTAPTGSNPTCNAGPACCEAGPATDPGTGDMPVTMTDTEHALY